MQDQELGCSCSFLISNIFQAKKGTKSNFFPPNYLLTVLCKESNYRLLKRFINIIGWDIQVVERKGGQLSEI